MSTNLLRTVQVYDLTPNATDSGRLNVVCSRGEWLQPATSHHRQRMLAVTVAHAFNVITTETRIPAHDTLVNLALASWPQAVVH